MSESKKKILIVEDNSEMRALERNVLQHAGYEVFEADKADIGISLATDEMPDVILMDIRLPYKTRGIGAAKILRRDERTKDIPIIFVTAYGEWEHTKEVENITRTSYITKPFIVDDLLQAIGDMLEGNEGG